VKWSIVLRNGLRILVPVLLTALAGCYECPDGLCEIEPNDSISTANVLESLEQTVHGGIYEDGDEDIFQLTLTTTSDVRLETFDENGPGNCLDADTVLELLGSDGAWLADDDENGIASCSAILPADQAGVRHLAPGTYYARVSGYAGLPVGGYTLVLNRESVCGDGSITGTERCDDHNTTDGDGCSHACRPEAPSEVEPNGDSDHATALSLPALVRGALMPEGDIDYYRLTLSAPATVTVETFDGSGDDTCVGVDTVVQLRTADGDLLEESDDSEWSFCSWIERQLSAGTYLVRVQSYEGTATGYHLSVR